MCADEIANTRANVYETIEVLECKNIFTLIQSSSISKLSPLSAGQCSVSVSFLQIQLFRPIKEMPDRALLTCLTIS